MKYRTINFILFATALIASSQTIVAQSSSTLETPLPKLMLLPWETTNIDDDSLQQSSSARFEITRQLKKMIAPTSVSLDTIAPNKPSLESARRTLSHVFAEQNAAFTTPLAIIPIWSRVHNYDLFAIIVVDSQHNTIKSVLHKLIPRNSLLKRLRTSDSHSSMVQAFNDLSTALNLNALPQQNEDLAVAIRDQTLTTRSNEIDRTTLSTLILAKWTTEFLAINPYSSELLSTIHRFYGQQSLARKANREVIAHASYDKVVNNASLPVTMTLSIRAVESIFAQPLPWTWSEPLTLAFKADNTLDLQFSDRLKTELTTERQSLDRSELPQIAKIRGAWAYVDKGRAWGLQMNDRLFSKDDPQKIKGHVVAYFGPELKLKSPRGWPINEGAIVFIRKGQRDVRVGQALTYDGLKVPTPWPPVAQVAPATK
jgi:hypothetical protein